MRPLFLIFTFVLASASLHTSVARAHTHFSGCVSLTGHNATILIPAAAEASTEARLFAEGDEIAAFTQDGTCAGVVTWTGKSLALTLWGDDPQSPGKSGFAPGELVTLKVWRSANGMDETAAASYATSRTYYRADGAYAEDAIYVISALNLQADVLRHRPDAAAKPAPNASNAFALAPNYPNPFSARTTIAYQLGQGAQVRLEIVNLLGRSVKTLVSAYQTAGEYELTFDAGDLPSGMYLCRLAAGPATQTRRMLLVR